MARLLALLLLVASALFVAGCSGGEEPTTPADKASSGPPALPDKPQGNPTL